MPSCPAIAAGAPQTQLCDAQSVRRALWVEAVAVERVEDGVQLVGDQVRAKMPAVARERARRLARREATPGQEGGCVG